MEQLKSFRLSVKTVAPLHIGGAGGLSLTQFVDFNGRVYVVSEDRLAQALRDKELLEDFADSVARAGLDRNSRISLRQYLEKNDLFTDSFIKGIALYSMESDAARPPYPEVRQFARDRFLRPFVPGSSVKGAIRVAILHSLLKKLQPEKRDRVLRDFVTARLKVFGDEWDEKRQQIEKATIRLDDDRRDREIGKARGRLQNDFKGRFSGSWEQTFFQKFTLSLPAGQIDAHTDIFRVLKVSDSSPVDEDLRIKEVKVYSMGRGEERRFSIYP